MRYEARGHIVESTETEYGIWLTGAVGRASVLVARDADLTPDPPQKERCRIKATEW